MVERVLGGRPTTVVIRLALISVLVGFIMTMLGLDAAGVLSGAIDFVAETIQDSSGLLRTLGTYLATGAALVVPIWLVMRLTASRK